MTYASIDLGSDTIKVVVMEYCDNKFNVLASANTRCVGIKKGIIRDPEMVTKSLELALSEVEKQFNFKIDKAIISIPGYETKIDLYKASCDVSGLVSGSDIANCFKRAIKENISDSEAVITVFPIDFVIDDTDKVIDPKGMEAYKMEARVVISTVPKDLVYSYLEIFSACGVDVIDLCFSTIGDYYQGKKAEYQKLSGAVVNIGSSKTEVSIFNKGVMIKNDILPIGSKQIDQDIKYIYHVNSLNARTLKEEFSLANSQYADNENLEINNTNGDNILIAQKEISEVVEARIVEILKSVKKHLNILTNKEISYIIISGGITDIPGFNSILETIFEDKANTLNMNVLGARNSFYGTAVGMIKYLYEKLAFRGINYSMYDTNAMKNDKKKGLLDHNIIALIEDFIKSN